MEIQFNCTTIRSLQSVRNSTQIQELTQEVRLPDGFPDVGRVLGCWGQPVLRGKEWRSGCVGANGGVMTWVLYAPEDGTKPRCVETWLPFDMKWDIPETPYDGTILLCPILRWADARTLSPRKMLARVDMVMYMNALTPQDTEYYMPVELPPDVQLLKRNRSLMVPCEAGEKAFAMEEHLEIPASQTKPEKIVRFCIKAELTDQKILADKGVFRGAILVHVLYRDAEGRLATMDKEIPFSQYAQLDADYGDGAALRVWPVVTEAETELTETGELKLKCSMTGQYMVYDAKNIELIEDAYSPERQLKLSTQQLNMPVVRQLLQQTVRMETPVQFDGGQVADLALYLGQPELFQIDGQYEARNAGKYQMLYYNGADELVGVGDNWQDKWQLEIPDGSSADMQMQISGVPQFRQTGEGKILADMLINGSVTHREDIQMVTGMELGEEFQPDPGRPSVILRRYADNGLWELAKEMGTTVEKIMNANALTQEPEPGKMLLIPVL